MFGVIFWVGDVLIEWICGDYLILGIILNCFFVLYVVVLFIVILVLVVLYIIVLYEVGFNNLDGIEIKKLKDENGVLLDGIFFYFYYSVYDLVGVVVFFFVFFIIVFFFFDGGGYFFEKLNFEFVNLLKILDYIVLVWYFMSFYVILRVILDKLLGVVVMGVFIVVLFVFLWLDCSLVKFICYKGLISKIMMILFVIIFIILGVCGVKLSDVYVEFVFFEMIYWVMG